MREFTVTVQGFGGQSGTFEVQAANQRAARAAARAQAEATFRFPGRVTVTSVTAR